MFAERALVDSVRRSDVGPLPEENHAEDIGTRVREKGRARGISRREKGRARGISRFRHCGGAGFGRARGGLVWSDSHDGNGAVAPAGRRTNLRQFRMFSN